MDVLIVHNINITKPCGNQIKTWTVEGAPQNWQKTLSCIYIYIYKTYRNYEIIQIFQICYLKFYAMNGDFQVILKLSQNSNTLILDKIWHIAIATNCHLIFTNYPVGLLYN